MSDVTLLRGDCLELMRDLAAGSVDAVITDPPYNMRGNGGVPIGGNGVAKVKNKSFSIGEPWGYSIDWIGSVLALKPKHVIVFCNSYMLGKTCYALEDEMIISAVFVWRKRNAPPNVRNTPKWDCEFIVWAKSQDATNVRAREFKSQVLEVPFPVAGCFASERILDGGTTLAAHPSQKPIAVIEPFVNRLTEPEWTILDPFLGTGTTGVACVKLNRRFIGMEINADYFALAQRRIAEAQMQMTLPLDFSTMERTDVSS